MKIKGKVILVTGANGGIGNALVQSMIEQGAAKIYACTRKAGTMSASGEHDTTLTPIQLDITNIAEIQSVAEQCQDVDILINNAGINRGMWLTGPTATEDARKEMEINFFGTLAMCQTFSSIIEARGGGMIINICSIIGLVAMPINGTYCASKAAVHSMLQGLRGELAEKNIQVLGVYPGPVDTQMTAGQDMPKTPPKQVADSILAALENGEEDIFPDPMSQSVQEQLKNDLKATEMQFSKMRPA